MALSQEATELLGMGVTALGIVVGAVVQIVTGRNASAVARAEASARNEEATDKRKDAELARAIADVAAARADAAAARAERDEAQDRVARMQAENLDLTRQLADELLHGTDPPARKPAKRTTRRTT